MEYYLDLKKVILSHATKWMNLEDTIISEISQSPKHKCCALKMVKMANFRLCLFSTIKLVRLNYFSQMTENWL